MTISRQAEQDLALSVFDEAWSMMEALAPASRPVPGILEREELPPVEGWLPEVSELNLLARPFMERANLDHLDVFVELWSGGEKLRGLPDEAQTRPLHQPAVWFDSVEEGLCIFGVEEGLAADAETCLSAMSAAVAAAFRHYRVVPAPSFEHGVTLDVTAALLGFFPAQLPSPTVLSGEALLQVVAALCHRTAISPNAVELALAPKWHALFTRLLLDA